MRAVFLLAAANLAWAEGSMQLSLKRAVEIALTPEGSTRVQLAIESVKQAETHLTEARGAFLPTIDGAITERSQTVNLQTFGINFSLPMFGFSVPSLVGPFTAFDARVSAEQSIFNYSDIRKYQASRLAMAATSAIATTAQHAIMRARRFRAGRAATTRGSGSAIGCFRPAPDQAGDPSVSQANDPLLISLVSKLEKPLPKSPVLGTGKRPLRP